MPTTTKGFRPKIRSRHPSHNTFRGNLPKFSLPCVIRFGSLTDINKALYLTLNKLHRKGRPIPRILEVNKVDAVKISSNKYLMKEAFNAVGVRTPDWIQSHSIATILRWASERYPIVSKHIYGSRGTGNSLIREQSQLETFLNSGKDLSKYIFEKYHNFSREYRLHVTEEGCFYTCRKMLKTDTPEHLRWFRNDANCVWIVEDNPIFDKPGNWEDIVKDCVRALKATGLDFAAVDVRVQSSTKTDRNGNEIANTNPEWFILETNSAPSMGEITEKMYFQELENIIKRKINEE